MTRSRLTYDKTSTVSSYGGYVGVLSGVEVGER